MSVILGLKLALVPALIAGVTLAGRRWGPGAAGSLSAFPVVAGPVLFFIAAEQGAPFAARASEATLSAVLTNLAFGISYAWSATRCSWAASAFLGFVSYVAAVAALNHWSPPLLISAIAVAVALAVAPHLYPKAPPEPAASATSASRGDIWWRMAAGAILVFLLTRFSSHLGPRLSGLLAMFPVMASVLAVFSHKHSGAGFTIKLLRGMVTGYLSFSCFCLVLSLSLPNLPIALAFSLSLGCAILVQGISRIPLNAHSRSTS